MPNPSVHCRELVGARDAEVGGCLQDARGRDAHVVVVGQRFLDERLQGLILEHGEPLHLREIFRRLLLLRGARLLRGRVRRDSAILAGHVQLRPLVVGPDFAAGQREQQHNRGDLLHA